MRVRQLVRSQKVQKADTGWRADDMAPRWCPIYPKTRPNRAGWQWRSARVLGGGDEFILVALVNPGRGDWKAVLMVKTMNGYSVVGRFEYHSSHPGQHFHSDCQRAGIEEGPTGMALPGRFPPAGSRHRRTAAFTPSSFWKAAREFFRIQDDFGPLYSSTNAA